MPDQPSPIPLRPDRQTRRFMFLLLDRFTMMSFAAAIEPLRLANRVAAKPLYAWTLVAEHPGEVACSNGAPVAASAGLDVDIDKDDTVIVCGGIDVKRAATRPVLNFVRRAARQGAKVGGLCTGAWVLAKAGLLDGRRAAIHWENHDAMIEEFPDVVLYRSVFVDDGNRLTAAGGMASADLMLRLIARDHGPELAASVADQLIHTAPRTEGEAQRISIPSRIGVRHPRLSSVIARMEANLEDPISPAKLATEAGMSMRQLERLFARYLQRTPKQYYMECRLFRARNLLAQTEMPVMEVALACGFTGTSHFSKCYRAQFGTTPFRSRATPDQRALPVAS